MAERKPGAARNASPSQAGRITKGSQQAGKPKAAGSSKAATATRQMQNKGVADGTVRLGKNGKSYNVYDAKTGTWKRGEVKAATPGKAGTNASAPKKVTRPAATKADKGIGVKTQKQKEWDDPTPGRNAPVSDFFARLGKKDPYKTPPKRKPNQRGRTGGPSDRNR